MEITVSKANGRVPVAVFKISGAITDNREIERQAKQVFEAGGRDILIDLSAVPYMATAGLRAMHAVFELLRQRDTPAESEAAVNAGIAAGTYKSPHLKLLSPNALVLEALSAGGYNEFLEIHTNSKQAIDSF